MTKPSSFSTMCTSNCAFELTGLLLSLSLFHRDETIYILTDTKTKDCILSVTPQPKLNIVWIIELDKYDGMNREIMEQNGIWSDFQMSKAHVIKRALLHSNDTLLLDSDIIITDEINDVNLSKDIGVSPHYMRKDITDKYGYYNGGMLWTKNINVADKWIEFTKTSRYYDQASIEDIAEHFSYFEFGENYNVQGWRMQLSNEGTFNFPMNISYKPNDKVYYKNKPLKFIHTHFLDHRFDKFNHLFIEYFKKANMYKILLIIYRVIHDKWLLKIPKQPIPGLGFHTNDSFRELMILMKSRTSDVDIQLTNDTIHCWIEPNILMYDRPTTEWCNAELNKASLFLLGNGDINVEGKLIKQNVELYIKPWIFWARKPMILEQILKTEPIVTFEERTIDSIFIGNIENSVQNKYRNNAKWSDVITEYHCTHGKKHLFTHKEYLMKIRQAKYGLCLRGYGSKCHREVELMAFGVIPLVTDGVTTTSYMEPLVENTHYLFVSSPDDLKTKIQNMSHDKWKQMSKNCFEWYQRNVHSSNCWNNMISNILYN